MSETKTFNIGDTAYVPVYGKKQTYVTCPHCFGDKHLTVILGDKSEILIDCECCREGWENKGKISIWEWKGGYEQITISGLESNIEGEKVKTRYHSGSRYCYQIYDEVFDNAEDALAYAEIKATEMDRQGLDEIENKKKYAHKSWASNAAYYHNLIRDAGAELVRLNARYTVAKEKAKKAKGENKSE
jgi:hypothetical protein